MSNEVVKTQELKEKLVYQRAVYRFHDCDDPELKGYYWQIIAEYNRKHPQEKKPKQQLLPGLAKEFDGRGIS